MSPPFHHVAIIGVGLIGGSLGMILRKEGWAKSVIGVGRRIENLKTAVALGAIDRYVADPDEGVSDADLVVLATPVDTYQQHLQHWGGRLRPGTIVTDVGSVKGRLVAQAESLLPHHVRFVGAHPIAGKEKTGVAAGSVSLFRGARCILTPTERTDADALEAVHRMWELTGCTVLTMDPMLHDKILGAVSHLPHVAAFALMNALSDVRDHQVPELDLQTHSGGGLRDTTRIAASSPEMWRDICVWNRDNLVQLIEVYERHLAHFKSLIRSGDGPGLEKEMEQAKLERERLTPSATREARA
ncbi:prephenate dehydrogenase [Nitrospira sp.]|nr:prephenate dehydrogenase [Nitrospira sp.]